MQETPTVKQPPQAPQPPVNSQHPYQEYAAVEQPPPASQPPTYQQQSPIYPPPMYPPPTYPPPQQPVPPPKKKMSTGMKWLIALVVFLALGFVGSIFQAIGGSGTSVQPTPTQQATPAPTPNPATVVPTPEPTQQPTPEPTQQPVVAAPKLLNNISVFEAVYGRSQYVKHFSGEQYYDTGYAFIHDGKNIYVFTMNDKVTGVSMKEAVSTLDDLKPYLPKDAGQPYDGGNGIQVYSVPSGKIALGTSEGFNILVFMPNEQ